MSACGRRGLRCFAGSAHVSLRLPLAEPFWGDVGPCQPATVHSPDRLMSAFGFHSPSPFGKTWGHVSLRLSIRRIGSCQPSASTRRALLGRRGAMSACDCPFAGSAHVSLRLPLAEPFLGVRDMWIYIFYSSSSSIRMTRFFLFRTLLASWSGCLFLLLRASSSEDSGGGTPAGGVQPLGGTSSCALLRSSSSAGKYK
jgi:hypothetical protein